MKGLDSKLLEKMKELRIARESLPEPGSSSYEIRRGSNKAVFLDRDGVIIENGHLDPPYDTPVDIMGSLEAMKGFRDMGFLIAIVTNQGAIGMGLIDHSLLVETMEFIREMSGPDIPWDMAYYCPYHEESLLPEYRFSHFDRKPEPGMLLRAAKDLDIDLLSSIMIGDHLKDVEAGHRAGCRSILLQTGGGKREVERLIAEDIIPGDTRYPDDIVYDLKTAYALIRDG